MIIEERPCPKIHFNRSFLERIKSKGISGSVKAIRSRIKTLLDRENVALQKKRQQNILEILGNNTNDFSEDIACKVFENINEQGVREVLLEEKPDVILVQGTSIVKDATVPKNVFNFNMHAGLSPYYRGGCSTNWALVNWDPYNIGVTLHALTEFADAGSIIAQKRVIPEDIDTSFSIELKLTKEGTILALAVLEKFARGENIVCYPQDLTIGKNYFSRHWHPALTSYLDTLEKKGCIREMLKYPSTKTQSPIVTI